MDQADRVRTPPGRGRTEPRPSWNRAQARAAAGLVEPLLERPAGEAVLHTDMTDWGKAARGLVDGMDGDDVLVGNRRGGLRSRASGGRPWRLVASSRPAP